MGYRDEYKVQFTGGEPSGSTGSGGGSGDLIGGLLYLGGSIYEGETAKRNTDKTIQANRNMAEYAYSQDLEAWNRQNQYNSPAAQMARLKEAGLNPNMIYGSGSGGASGNAAQMPKYNAPTVQYNYKPMVDLPRALGLYQDFQMRQAQINNVKAQTQNVNARTASEALRPSLMSTDQKQKDFNLMMDEHMRPYSASILYEKTKQSQAETQGAYKKLQLMDQETQLRELSRLRGESQLRSMSLEQEGRAADNLFKMYRNEWMREGVTSSDNPLLRIMVRMLGESGLSGVFETFKGQLDDYKSKYKEVPQSWGK